MSWLREREEFVAIMSREGMALEDIRRVLRDAQAVQRSAEVNWNREITGEERERWRRASNRILTACGTDFGVIFQSDPRGACVKIKVPSGKTNDWGQAGICVPTRSRP